MCLNLDFTRGGALDADSGNKRGADGVYTKETREHTHR